MSVARRSACLAALLAATVALGSCGSGSHPDASSRGATRSATQDEASRPSPTSPPPSTLPVPAALVEAELDLRSPAVAVPLQLEIPSLQVTSPVLAVGVTPANVMDAPTGSAEDPVWQETFWYRGGGIPGDPGTATMAGHVTDSAGRPATFARLNELQPGDSVVVRDLRTDLNVSFVVSTTETYSLDEASSPPVLARLYGAGPVAGTRPQLSSDGLSHLTLITCAGTFDRRLRTHDHRLAVFATRVG